jgi:hypothetical protein
MYFVTIQSNVVIYFFNAKHANITQRDAKGCFFILFANNRVFIGVIRVEK